MNIVLINLLPHREARRKKRREAFYIGVAGSVLAAAVLLGLGYTALTAMIDHQQSRNSFLKAQIAVLDGQIKDIATLRREIDALRARQKAVEDLQSDRNMPVFLFNDLTSLTPPGVKINSIRQQGPDVLLDGTALSQEHVADLLHALSASKDWLTRPDLVEIHADQPRAGQTVPTFDFEMRAALKRPTPASAAAAASAPAPAGSHPAH